MCLYVGQTTVGLTRPFERSHSMFGRKQEVTHIDIYPVFDRSELLILEKKLTKSFKPKYDKSFLAGYGYQQHLCRLSKTPKRMADEEKINDLIKRCFPGDKRKSLIERWIKIIHMYYKEEKTSFEISERLGMTVKAVESVIYRANKTMNRPKNSRGRPVTVNIKS